MTWCHFVGKFRFIDDIFEINDQSRCIRSGPPCLQNIAAMSFKMAAIPINFDYISDYSGHTILVLMAIPRFYWPKNPPEQ